jgi:hypothetical protein
MGLADRDYMHERHREREKIRINIYNPKAFRGGRAAPSRWDGWGDGGIRQPDVKLPKTAIVQFIAFWLIIIAAIYGAYNFFQREPSPPLPLPENGSVTIYSMVPDHVPTGPFQIEVSPGQSEKHYFITASDWHTSVPVRGVFVRSGHTAKIQLPLGAYRISIAEGKEWYGPQRLFGRKTVIKEGVHPISLYPEAHQGHTRIRGHVITLPGTVAGNFRTKDVPR